MFLVATFAYTTTSTCATFTFVTLDVCDLDAVATWARVRPPAYIKAAKVKVAMVAVAKVAKANVAKVVKIKMHRNSK